jgi:hypothetical protein
VWLRAHVEAMESIEAAEAFRQAEIIAIAEGRLPKRKHAEVTRRWSESLKHEEQKPRSAMEVFRSLGIGVKIIGPR